MKGSQTRYVIRAECDVKTVRIEDSVAPSPSSGDNEDEKERRDRDQRQDDLGWR
jgi:hypothetical protein